MKKITLLLLLLFSFSCVNAYWLDVPVLTSEQIKKTESGILHKKQNVDNGLQHATGVKNAYAILTLGVGENISLINKVIQFPLQENPVFSEAFPFYETSSAGAYGNGFYYIASTKLDGSNEIPNKLIRVDLENKTSSVVGSLSDLDNFVNDMTYDYSSSTMFAITRDKSNAKSVLYSINLSSASANKIATLEQKFLTLACTYDGMLYAISFSGDFYSIDKVTGKTTLIGSTGYQPTYFQSMEFDHSTGVLYWVPNVIEASGSVVVETNMLATIDINTGCATPIGLLADDIQLAGLYIPFVAAPSATPAAVSNFTVIPAADGTCKATLSWVNPLKTFGGKELVELQKIEILRDGKIIKTLNSPIPGAEQAFTDAISTDVQGGFHQYTVIAYNEAGAGAPAEQSVFIGLDIPATPDSLTYQKKSSRSVTLSWNASKLGANGGKIDKSTLSYRLVRNPGEVLLAEGIKDTCFSDEELSEIDGYTYQVFAVNAQGTSEPAVTPKIVLGPTLNLPYDCNFSTPSQCRIWTVVDSDVDGNTWKMEHAASLNAYCATYRTPAEAPADDWLLSHAMNIKQGETYKVSFNVFSLGPNDFSFELLENYNPRLSIQTVADFSQIKCYMFSSKSFMFTAEKSGEFNMGIHVKSQPNTSWLYLTDYHIEKIVDNNLAAVALKGTDSPVFENSYQYMIQVENKGRIPQTAYTVNLKDASGRILGTSFVSDTLGVDMVAEVPVKWTVKEDNVTEIQGEVLLLGDQIIEDNVTEKMTIVVQPKGSSDKISLGMNTETNTSSFPFTLGSTKSANQNIYAASEIGFKGGWINKISYLYLSNATKPVVEVPIKIYLANTERNNNKGGWISENEYTLVFDGTVSCEKGQNQMEILLDNAFFYEGKNLAVLTTHEFDGYDYAIGISFLYYTSPLVNNYAIGYDGNAIFNFTQYPSRRSGNSSVIMYMMAGEKVVSGKVMNQENEPLPDAKVRILELGIETTTDQTGCYHIGYVPEGIYTLECRCDGYPNQRVEKVQIGKDGLNQDFCMHQLKSYSVYGRVKAPDGTALAGGEVWLRGYHSLKTVTDEQGLFSFKDVVVFEENMLEISKDWYQTYSKKFDFTDGDVNLGDIKLEYYIYPVVNADLEATEEGMEIRWNEAFNEAHLRKDSGKTNGQYGLSSDSGMGLIGTSFKTPLLLEEVSWYTTQEGGPHNTVNLYIFELDETGKPTDKLLYAKRSIINEDNQWMVHVLDTPIIAPHGCAVTLNYPGFLGIALDTVSYEFPFVEETFVYAKDYNKPEFDYLDNLGLRQNLLIRASGKVLPENLQTGMEHFNVPKETAGILRFKVWRMTEENISENDWTELTSDPIATISFLDKDWKSLPPAVYRYAICSIYPDGRSSKPVFTAYKSHNMELEVTVRVKTNAESQSASDAVVTLIDQKENRFSAVVGKSGEVIFPNLWKGIYQISISLPGFESLQDKQAWNVENSYITEPYLLKEIIGAPFNLSASVEGTTAHLFWNEAGDIFDDFEEHPDFMVASAGKAGWNYLDQDSAYTYASQAFDFPHRQEPMSYIVFNPYVTKPAVDGEIGMQPHSGKKFLACFNAIMGNDDYIFSPKLNYHEGGILRFYAKSYVAAYQDSFRVGYSNSGKNLEDFIWFDTENPSADSWNLFTYELPAGTQYITINCNSGNNGFILMIDDITISSGKNQEMFVCNHAPEVSYEISMDGEIVSTTKETEFVLNELDGGTHIIGIKAIYHSGISEESNISINVASSINQNESELVYAYLNSVGDKVYINGSFITAALYDTCGYKVDEIACGQSFFDLSGLPKGIYIIRLIDNVHNVKFLKVHI